MALWSSAQRAGSGRLVRYGDTVTEPAAQALGQALAWQRPVMARGATPSDLRRVSGAGRGHAMPRGRRACSWPHDPERDRHAPGTPREAAVPGAFSHHSRPNSAAVSDMRLEKPHSLSYQPITRIIPPPSTLWVWVASKVQLAGLWLKSTETSGAVL